MNIMEVLETPRRFDALVRLGFNEHQLSAVLPKLVRQGVIQRNVKGQYVKPKKLEDRPLPPDKKPHHTCQYCGEWVHRPTGKYCGRECMRLAKTKPKPICRRCGNPCSEVDHRYCSHACRWPGRRG